jgi:hypothetical protein
VIGGFYLAGGTGLALRLGHRISVDLDLFANIETLDDMVRQRVVAALEAEHKVERLQDSVLGLVLNVDGQACSFFSYGFPLLAPLDSVSGLSVAGMLDIGLMKLDAIVGRGTRKDFYDLFFIVDYVPLDELLGRSSDKYSHSRDFGMQALTAMVDFRNADQQEEPTMLAPAEWEQVKAFFRAEARRLGHAWFDQ